MPPKRMTANPIAPLRYRAGKPLPANNDASDSESESESESDSETDQHASQQKKAPARPPQPTASSFPKLGGDLAARQKAAADARAKELEAQAARLANDEGFVTASESDDERGSSEEGSEESEDDDDYDSESSADKPRFTAPTFVTKARRAQNGPKPETSQADRSVGVAVERDKHTMDEDEEAARKKAKADAMLQAQIERTARERAEGRRDWDDEDAGAFEEVDDRDGLDPAAEHAAWRLRELKRVKREREAIEVVEREKEEVERRRNLTAEERDREDAEWIGRQKEERDARGKMGYMQKYFHKGAFFQEDGEGADEATRQAKARDVMGARFVDDAANRELLPEYMQIRDMTKLGKKGRTRYKDLKSEDTGRFAADLDPRRGRGDAGGRYDGPSGANNVAVGERRRRDDDRDDRDEKRPRFDR